MARTYGKIPRGGKKKKPAAAPLTSEILIAIHGRHTLEQLARELQIAVARLQDHGVHGVEKFRIRLEMRDREGEPMAAWDPEGKPVRLIQIPEPAETSPYRPGPYEPSPIRQARQPAPGADRGPGQGSAGKP